jgi:sarcosine oxidase subunit alpha
MTGIVHRLAADAPHGFAGNAIDRGKPLQFRLNGRAITGFTGDTVLSAALANGIQVAGRHGDEAVALDEGFAPLVSTGRGSPLPMDRTPAIDGLDLTTVGQRRDPIASRGFLGALRNRLVGPGRTLNHSFGETGTGTPPWLGAPAETVIEADFAIVGAGVAGLSAAATAAAAGKSVVLIEHTPHLGGNIRYFGVAEGEFPPEATIARLVEMVTGKPEITTLLRADAFAVTGTTLRVHQVTTDTDRPSSRVVAVRAGHIVVATGAIERLPLFPGNRTPGVVGALAAFNRAERYGVWSGERALFTTPQSYPYRLALRIAEAGVKVQRIIDSRVAPASRYLDFAKAMGITLASALVPSQAEPLQRNQPGLRVNFVFAIAGVPQDNAPIDTDLLVAAGAWQPDIQLWLRAGGGAGWDLTNGWLAPRNRLPHGGAWRGPPPATAPPRLRHRAAASAAVLEVSLGKAAPRCGGRGLSRQRSKRPTRRNPDRARQSARRRAVATYLDRGAFARSPGAPPRPASRAFRALPCAPVRAGARRHRGGGRYRGDGESARRRPGGGGALRPWRAKSRDTGWRVALEPAPRRRRTTGAAALISAGGYRRQTCRSGPCSRQRMPAIVRALGA